LEDITSSCNCL